MTSPKPPSLKAIFNEWAQQHPNPDVPAYGTGAAILTPRQFNREIQNETPYGKMLMDNIGRTLPAPTVEALAERMERFKAPKR